MKIITGTGATVLAGIGALHVAWGLGTTWPMANKQDLGEVTGGCGKVSSTVPCFIVGGGLIGAAGLVAGLGGSSTPAQLGRWALASGLAARGLAGGEVAMVVLGMPDASERFRTLDTLAYRPLCLALAATAAVSARSQRRQG